VHRCNKYVHTLLTHWRISCNHQHLKMAFFVWPPSPISPPQRPFIRTGWESTHYKLQKAISVGFSTLPNSQLKSGMLAGRVEDFACCWSLTTRLRSSLVFLRLHEILPDVHRRNLIDSCNIEMLDITEVYKVSASVNLYLRSKTLECQLLNFRSSCDCCWMLIDVRCLW